MEISPPPEPPYDIESRRGDEPIDRRWRLGYRLFA